MVFEVSNFETEVIEGSRERPVLVDFWAPWCGPCRQLGPVLKKIAEDDATFTLAKVNTDLNPEVSQRYRVSSIPAVKLFVDGEVVDEFIGALPEEQVRRWLAAALPSATSAAVTDAQAILEAGDGERAAALLEEVLRDSPTDAEASALLARAIAFRDPERAASLAHQAASTNSEYTDLAQAVRLIATLVERDNDPIRLPADPARSSYADGVKSLRDGDVDQALRYLVESVRLNRGYEDEAARRACVAIFKVLGQSHELTRKHRRALEMVLFGRPSDDI